MTCAVLGGAACGCQSSIPRDALALSPQSVERRVLQTRSYDTTDEATILQASAGLLQDVGFTIEATRSSLGLLTGSKDRDATDGGQVVRAILIAALLRVSTPIDAIQKIRISIVTHPEASRMAVRVTFQRVVWNNHGQISNLEFLDDPKMYQDFFDKLSKAVFLEANKI